MTNTVFLKPADFVNLFSAVDDSPDIEVTPLRQPTGSTAHISTGLDYETIYQQMSGTLHTNR